MASISDAKKYNRLGDHNQIYRFGRTDYLVTKELPNMIRSNIRIDRVLDFGCGAGLSTRFIKSLGYHCVGVDVNDEMISLAKKNDPSGEYIKTESQGILPFINSYFDAVISVFVLFEIPSIKSMVYSFKEINRVLNDGGIFIAITGSEELYKRNWLSLDANFPENKGCNSGDICKIKLLHVDLVVEDYYWTDNDYYYVANQSGFQITKKLFPIGTLQDGIKWKDETKYAPFVFYKFEKLS